MLRYQKLNQNSRYAKVQLKYLATHDCSDQYELHYMCSEYIDGDKKVQMKKTNAKK